MPLFRRRRGGEEAAGAAVVLTERALQVRRPKGRDESVAWEDIAMIRAVAERAPEDGEVHVFLVLGDVEGTAGCVVPAAHAPAELTDWVLGLPGFDRRAYDAAAEAATGEPVTVWVRP